MINIRRKLLKALHWREIHRIHHVVTIGLAYFVCTGSILRRGKEAPSGMIHVLWRSHIDSNNILSTTRTISNYNHMFAAIFSREGAVLPVPGRGPRSAVAIGTVCLDTRLLGNPS